MAAARHAALNPVRAGLVERAEDWRWSSARAHLDGRDDTLVQVGPLLEHCGGRFADLLDAPASGRALSGAAGGGNDRPPARLGGVPGFPSLSRLVATRAPSAWGPKPRMEQLAV